MDPRPNYDVPLNAPPGSYIRFDPKGQSVPAQDRRLSGRFRMNIIASVTSDGSLYTAPNVPVPIGGVADVIEKAGKRSGARYLYEYLTAAVPSGLDVVLTPIVMTGTAAVYRVNMVLIGSATAASGSGTFRFKHIDYEAQATINSGDTPATIMTALKAALDGTLTPSNGPGAPVPCGSGALVSNTELPFTWAVPGVHGQEHPIACWIDPSVTGVGLALGTAADGSLVFANGPTGAGAGSVTVTLNNKSVVTSGIAMGKTDEEVCALVAAAINASGDFPCWAQVRATATTKLDLIMKPGRVCQRLSTTVNANAAPMTVTQNFETTAGSGVPSLSTALANLENYDACAEWVTEFDDATSLGLIATHIRAQGNGYRQKEQHLTFGLSSSLTTSGAVVSSVSPSLLYEDNLASSPGRFTAAWTQNSFQRRCGLAAMRAAIRCAQRRPTRNLNGYPIVSQSATVPLTLPDVADRPSQDSSGQARKTYFMTPLVVKDGTLTIEADTTTYGGTLPGWATSEYAHGAANWRQEVLAGLSVFQGLEYVVNSPPQVPDVFDTSAVENNIYNSAKRLEKQNLYDGADRNKSQFRCVEDPNYPGWCLIAAPFTLPRRLDVIAGNAFPAG